MGYGVTEMQGDTHGCKFLGHDIWSRVLKRHVAIPPTDGRQLGVQFSANPEPSNPESTCIVDKYSSNMWRDELEADSGVINWDGAGPPRQSKEPRMMQLYNTYFEWYPYKHRTTGEPTCIQVLQKDTVHYTLTEQDDPTYVTATFQSYNTHDCTVPSGGVPGTIGSHTVTRTDTRPYFTNIGRQCSHSRHCRQGKRADTTLLEASFSHHVCTSAANNNEVHPNSGVTDGQCRAGNVGDLCSVNADCKYCASNGVCCDTDGTFPGCQGRCVADDAETSLDWTYNCPARVVHDMHCMDREMGWPGHDKSDTAQVQGGAAALASPVLSG